MTVVLMSNTKFSLSTQLCLFFVQKRFFSFEMSVYFIRLLIINFIQYVEASKVKFSLKTNFSSLQIINPCIIHAEFGKIKGRTRL
jgi:hypothetical protein